MSDWVYIVWLVLAFVFAWLLDRHTDETNPYKIVLEALCWPVLLPAGLIANWIRARNEL